MNVLITWFSSWTLNGKLAILFFPVFAGLLLFSSLKLVKWAEVIIHKTKFGGGFVGGTLIATITSMPELITEITQSAAGTPENGIGDDIGSNAFSIVLIGVGAILLFRNMFLNKFDRWTKISMVVSFFLTLALSIFLLINRIYGFADINSNYIGLIPAGFFLAYLLMVFLSYKFGEEDNLDQEFKSQVSVKKAIWYFALASVALITFSVFLNVDIRTFQDAFNIPSESIGGVFLAITTSLPEIVAFFVFMRKGHPVAAISSLIGSHFFNLGILFFGDLAYTQGPIFNNPKMSHHMPLAFMTVGMLGLFLLHFFLAKKFSKIFSKRLVYLIIPSIIVVGYLVGWTMILIFNS